MVKFGRKTSRAVAKAEDTVDDAVAEVAAPSPNPMTNLVLADIALRSGGQLLRHVVELTLLGTKYPRGKAKAIVKGRSMTRTLVGTALARIATRSVSGAIVIGGGMLAKTLYDHKHARKAEAEGKKAVDEQAARD